MTAAHCVPALGRLTTQGWTLPLFGDHIPFLGQLLQRPAQCCKAWPFLLALFAVRAVTTVTPVLGHQFAEPMDEWVYWQLSEGHIRRLVRLLLWVQHRRRMPPMLIKMPLLLAQS